MVFGSFPRKKKIFNIAAMNDPKECGDMSCRVIASEENSKFLLDEGSLDEAVEENVMEKNENTSLSPTKNVRFIDTKSAKSNFLHLETVLYENKEVMGFKYESLSEIQKRELNTFCWNAFRKGWKDAVMDWIGCFHLKSTVWRRGKTISPLAFNLVRYLRENAVHTKFIFRCEPDKEAAAEIARCLYYGRTIDYEGTDVLVLANGLKNYIGKYLDGLIPVEVFLGIKDCVIDDDKHRKKALLSYIPFLFDDFEREFLRLLFSLISEVCRNTEETKMTLDSLLGLFSLVLLPQSAFKTLDDLGYTSIVVKELYNLDFDALPQAVVVHDLIFV